MGLRPQAARHEIGCVGFDHQAMRRNRRHQWQQVQAPPFITYPACDADGQIQLQAIRKLAGLSREAMRHAIGQRAAELAQDADEIRVRIALVQEYRLAYGDCDFQQGAKCRDLRIAWRKIAVVIQAAFANRHDGGSHGQFAQFIKNRGRQICRMVGMEPCGGKQARWMCLMQRDGGARGGHAGAGDDHAFHARVRGAAQHLRQVRCKALMRQVRANVDQFGGCRCYHRGVRISDNSSAPQLPLWSEPVAPPVAQVRHSQRARRVSVRIMATGAVELVVPRGVSERHARAFLDSRQEWVRFHVERRRAMAPAVESFPPAQIKLQLTGESWSVFQAGGNGALRLREVGNVLTLRGDGSRDQQRRAIRRWLCRRAHAVLLPMLDATAAEHGFSFSELRVRCQRTRWGSCSSKGVISLNLALLFQPADVVRYLLCHELSHTRHMNHSARFWRCVAQCEPRWRELDAQLCGGWRHVPVWLREKS
jgi:predicted metal-dependent hydrolase